MKKQLFLSSGFTTKGTPLGKYYFDFSGILNQKWPFDQNGIRLRPYAPPLFYQYHPMAIAEYALDCHRLYLETSNSDYKDRAISNGMWFVNNITDMPNGEKIWIFDYKDTMRYNVRDNYVSAMVQGYALSLMVRLFEITGDAQYISCLEGAVKAYELPVKKGGFVNVHKGHIVYEEAPSTPPSCILNGFVYSLLGLHDVFRLNSNVLAKRLFDRGTESLMNLLPAYDTGRWSRYNLQYENYLTSEYYHNMHILQMDLLHRITGETIFLDFSKKWADYTKSYFNRLRHNIEFYYYRNKYKLQRIKAFISSF